MKPSTKETEDEPNLHWTSCLARHPRLSILGEQNPTTRICNSSPLLLSKETNLSAVSFFCGPLVQFCVRQNRPFMTVVLLFSTCGSTFFQKISYFGLSHSILLRERIECDWYLVKSRNLIVLQQNEIKKEYCQNQNHHQHHQTIIIIIINIIILSSS